MLLVEKLKSYRLILASHSPRRRELLAGCGFRFDVADSYEVEESYPDGMPAEEVPAYLSRLKSDAYPLPLAERNILITADTVVIAGGRILGKPADRDDAIRTLRELSGRTHSVVTGVTLRDATHAVTFDVSTGVVFRRLRDEEIVWYVDTCRPYDKAGAYGIQEWIGHAAIERIDGSFYNVMGLPVQKLYVMLEKFTDQR